VGTTASCPHVIDIKFGVTTGGLVGGDKFGSPEEIQSLVTIIRKRIITGTHHKCRQV